MSRFLKGGHPVLVIIGVALIFLITFMAVTLLWGGTKEQPAYDVTGVLSDGKTLYSLSDNYGKTGSVLLFYDMEDATSAELMETFAAIAPEYKADILAVSISQKPMEEQLQMLKEAGITFPHLLFDPEGTIAETYNVHVPPTTYFIDKNGLVQDVYPGPISEKSIRKELKAIE